MTKVFSTKTLRLLVKFNFYFIACTNIFPRNFKVIIDTNKKQYFKSKTNNTLCGLVSWELYHKAKVTGSIPIRAHAWVAGSVPGWGKYKRQPINVSHIDVSFPVFSLPSLLCKNTINFLKKVKQIKRGTGSSQDFVTVPPLPTYKACPASWSIPSTSCTWLSFCKIKDYLAYC